VLQGLLAFFLLTLLACAALPYRWGALAVSTLGAITPLAVISSGIVCFRKGHPGARYFLLAWTLLMVGVSMMGARNLGLVPTNFFTLYGIQIGSALEMLLLSFALADRIQILRREKDAAQNDAIHAIGHRLQSVVNTIPDYIFYKDSDGRFLGCNKAFETLLGRSESELIGKTIYDFVPEERARYFSSQDKQAMAGKAPHRYEEWMPAADGRNIFLEMIKTPLFGTKGELLGLIGVGRDITERQRNIEQERTRNMIFELLAKGGELPEVLLQVVQVRSLAAL
jgi:PAS domain S-box-containing protein